MRNTVIGLVLAAVLLAGLFYAGTHRAQRGPVLAGRPVSAVAIKAAADAIQPGFVGLKQVGAWTVACAASPLLVDRAPVADKIAAAGPPAGKVSLGRCRSMLEYRSKKVPDKIVLAMIFRIVGRPPGKLALFIRLPFGKKGDKVSLRLGHAAFALPIAGCAGNGCTAVGVLAPGSEKVFAVPAEAQLILPPGPQGKRAAVAVPLAGLSAAVEALRRAQS